MTSDLVVKEFFEWRSGNSSDMQLYLDGDNEWKLPIISTDIYYIGYVSGDEHTSSYNKGISGVLLVHKIPGSNEQ